MELESVVEILGESTCENPLITNSKRGSKDLGGGPE